MCNRAMAYVLRAIFFLARFLVSRLMCNRALTHRILTIKNDKWENIIRSTNVGLMLTHRLRRLDTIS